MKSIMLFLLSSLPCLAQDAPCPVTVEYVSVGQSMIRPLFIGYKNQSDKDIIGIRFAYEWMGATGDFADAYYAEESWKVKPHKGRTIAQNPAQRFPFGIRASVDSVSFSDGTVWRDPGTMKCSKVMDFRGK